jgi:hypothetical protein
LQSPREFGTEIRDSSSHCPVIHLINKKLEKAVREELMECFAGKGKQLIDRTLNCSCCSVNTVIQLLVLICRPHHKAFTSGFNKVCSQDYL